MYYRHKDTGQRVTAAQGGMSHPREFIKVMRGGQSHRIQDGCVRLTDDTTHPPTTLTVQPGQWVVAKVRGDWRLMEHEAFTAQYQEDRGDL